MKPMSDPSSLILLNKQSVLGLYVRRAIIMFQKLTFHRVVALYEQFKDYVNDCLDITHSINETTLDEDIPHKFSTKVWGGRQAELLVAQQAQALLTDEHKALPPAELQALVKDLLSCSPYYAEAHYLSYLNCLRVNEYTGALHSLYHCFDRLTPVDSSPRLNEDKLRSFRYAALNLAALHAQFGYKKLAQLALKEAIMLAQEAGDNVCLQLAHSWNYYLTDKNKGSLIERSITKATELGMTHTASLALIASAHEAAMEGKSPHIVFETLTKSDSLNSQHTMIDLMSMIYAEKTALWAYYGKTEMASVCAQLLLLFNSGEKKQPMFNGESTCQAVVTIANILHEMGEYVLASVVLSHAKERFPNQPSSRIWALSELLQEFSKLLKNEKWSAAERIADQMSSLDPIESKFRMIEVLFAKHDFPKAIDLAYELDEMENITAQQKVRAKLLISQIKCGSCEAGTEGSATSSVLLLCSALDIAKKAHLSYYEALVKMYMVNVQLLLRMPYQALRNLQESIIQILANGGLYDQARAYVTYAKCLSANAANQPEDNRRVMLHEAIKQLCKAKSLFEKLEANDRLKTTLYFLSRLYHEIDMHEERNMYAFEFKQLDHQFPTEKNYIYIF
ncbi:anaphase-promoting complex subunit 5 isoform X2 [Phymastichus coffea]|nr:anaphase-promoting complex subunit 5 isoform X2 [Phymastichus coffea]